MANLVVARACNLKCPYCFARSYFQSQQRASKSPFISMEVFEQQLDFLERSGIDEIRLIGGEPMLHPQFPELIRRARKRNKHILVFTNGLVGEEALDSLLSLPPETCTLLVNMNTSGEEDGSGLHRSIGPRRQAVLRQLGRRAVMSYTIYTPVFDLMPIQNMLLEAGCLKIIRLGLAHPTRSGRNEYLNPGKYALVGVRIAAFARIAAQQGIILDFDCGFIPCMFSDEDLETLCQSGANIGWHCNPILDIDLDQTVFFCFPLEDLAIASLKDGMDAAQLRAQMAAQVRSYDAVGMYKECSKCPLLLNGECTGGCLANKLMRLRPARFSLRVPI
jgi:radical SAM protein with 4Fe4S-binding SPASM domain